MSAPATPTSTPKPAPEAQAPRAVGLSPEAAALRNALGLDLGEAPRGGVQVLDRSEADAGVPAPAVIRYHHHQIARLLAQGRKPADIALATGYSAGYVSQLKNHDPAFQQLIAHYEASLDAIMASAGEQIRALGEEAIAVLRDRLISNPDDFPRGTLMELIELAFGKQGGAKAAGLEVGKNPSAQPIAVQVTFVGRDSGTDSTPHPAPQIVDGAFRVVEPAP